MIERQRGNRTDLLQTFISIKLPGQNLMNVGDHVPVRQHGALRYAGRTARVLQEGNVGEAELNRLQGLAGAGGQRLAETCRSRQVECRHLLFQMPQRKVDDRPFRELQHVADAG